MRTFISRMRGRMFISLDGAPLLLCSEISCNQRMGTRLLWVCCLWIQRSSVICAAGKFKMWRYLEGAAKPPEPKRPKTDCEKRATQRAYDHAVRDRRWQPGWSKEFPWLIHDPTKGRLYCKPCRQSYGELAVSKLSDTKGRFQKYSKGPFVVGSANFKHGSFVDQHTRHSQWMVDNAWRLHVHFWKVYLICLSQLYWFSQCTFLPQIFPGRHTCFSHASKPHYVLLSSGDQQMNHVWN